MYMSCLEVLIYASTVKTSKDAKIELFFLECTAKLLVKFSVAEIFY